MSYVNAIEPPVRISDAIKKASKATGADFNYLLTTAARESSFRPGAQARTSSAAGLFQFIDSTWLQTVKDEGPRFGLGDYADKIFRTDSGKYYVPDDHAREKILRLRFDPDVASVMAGAFTRQNADYLNARIGRQPSQGELYIAHFLGAEGANQLISLSEERPHERADRHFPRAAASNRGIFYTHGTPNSVSQVYENLVSDHSRLEAATVASLPASEVRKLESIPEGALASKAEVKEAPRIQLASASLLESHPRVAGLFRGPVIGPPKIRLDLFSADAAAPRPMMMAPPDVAAAAATGSLPEDAAAAAIPATAETAPSSGSIGTWKTVVREPSAEAAPPAEARAEPVKPRIEVRKKSAAPEAETAQPVKRAARRHGASAQQIAGTTRSERFHSADFWQMIRMEGS
ncbi:MAG: transglycosylase SLT domain-containing protein [Pseudomonadota bacterium]|nr:transglycosylase SLT domain-containing protein [Pseudomonadota bacterium]